MNIKDLLKDSYKDGMTLEEIETALADIELPSDGSAMSKDSGQLCQRAIPKPPIIRDSLGRK